MKNQLRQRAFHTLGALAVAAWALAFSADAASGQAAPVAAVKSVNAGVYSAAQATRGEALFAASCTGCHDTKRFTGDDFLTSWTGQPLHALFSHVSTTMPEDNPGSLKPQQYADVIAYFLKLNKFPAGTEELKGTAEAMKAVKLEKQAK